jgi:ABC-2 type transport system ATP-binding protein
VNALADLDFALHRGSVIALLGPNGAGKSTFVNLVLGRAKPQTGTISVLGHTPGHRHVRLRTGAMLQSAVLARQLSVREHIELHSGYYAAPHRIADVLAAAGLTALANRRFSRLSGGEQRRVQFALAICGRPDLLVLDEPTTALDMESRGVLWDAVRQHVAQGAAVLLTTHQLEEAEALADEIVVLAGGRLVARGSPEEIRRRVGTTRIRCTTVLDDVALHCLPGVHAVRSLGRYRLLESADPQQTLKALLATDPSISDMEVTGATLEDAVRELLRKETA